ncbi:two-component sensor histidine kinase [Actinoplanes philippinensis]|uniref:histidine kinase n=1 Tax=Actinoplanes philippinensis TaxID=35752 RepID=A0A1I2HLQ9_9ACTN|nr:HAMP domain-containing sensor histidine kinase [Actinoplanes philippinensis]GIE74072.1 two-component sensor histidine kinase [Actinoplanes philippinensis]SFF30200.1 two-component system, OmpR family, sensor histidine kinase BaeS [Actinoplanes philippinensis]
MTADRVPVRHSLITRLLITSMVIAVAAIASTAWLAATTTTRAISHEQGGAAADQRAVYQALLGYAATHHDWSGAATMVHSRAEEIGRRITLTTDDRRVILDSHTGPVPENSLPAAAVDPLDVDLGLTGGVERIDERAVGPYVVPGEDRYVMNEEAESALSCFRKLGYRGVVDVAPTGRPSILLTSAGSRFGTPVPDHSLESCSTGLDSLVSAGEKKALQELEQMTARCLGLGDRADRLRITPTFQAYLGTKPVVRTRNDDIRWAMPSQLRPAGPADVVEPCVASARRMQLRPYVAPRVLLFVTTPGDDRTTLSLSGAGIRRIAAVAAVVLLGTVVVTVLAGWRLVRPLRTLTDAAAAHVPATVSSRDEIGRLARALNDATRRREQADEQRRTMVNDVAHELRTPLGNIRTWLEAAQDDLAPTDAQLLALLHEEALQLQHIIDDLGDLAAADAGTLRVEMEPIPLRDVIVQVVDSQQGSAYAAGVRLEADVTGDPVVTADQARLRQVVGNLVSNAIRYTAPGGSVTVGAADTTISVRDTGAGIAPDDLPKIFDRFWRADGSRSRATGGSGLGLAIARQLTEAHGGTIEVESEPGRGTVFTVHLPDPAGA